MAALPAIAHEAYGLALACLVLNRLMDGLAGAMRATKPSDFGAFWISPSTSSSIPDLSLHSLKTGIRFSGSPPNLSFMGTGCSFLAYAIIAAKTGQETEKRGKKSFYYLGGIMEGTGGLFSDLVDSEHFPMICYVCAVLCWITTATRILAAAGIHGTTTGPIPQGSARPLPPGLRRDRHAPTLARSINRGWRHHQGKHR